MVDSTPEEIADQMLAADPINLLKTAADVYVRASKREDRQMGAMLAVQSAIIYMERNAELKRQELAPLQALAGALNDLMRGVPTELLERPVIGGKPSQERSTLDDRKAAGIAAVDHLINIGLSPTGHAEEKIAQIAGVTAKQVKHWRKLKRLKASLTYSLFETECADANQEQTLQLYKNFLKSQP